MRKTKIVCTLGPAVDSEDMLRRLMLEGMDVARMNFSHGTHEEQLQRLQLFMRLRDELGLHIPVLLDTKGPEIRLGTFKDEFVELYSGDPFTLTTRDVEGDTTISHISYMGLPDDVAFGTRILIDDGLVELTVRGVEDTDIYCEVKNGGRIGNRKGVNVPGAVIRLPSMTRQDEEDILFGIEHDYDFIAVSFVRSAQDALTVRKFLEKHGGAEIRIISKIENRQGIDNFEDILRVSDGIMVARGDLGVEIPVEEIPIVQKQLIRKCYKSGKPVITATQMLDSMMRNPRPTRAETTDIANAIFDGTSAIMLSGETASGKYPIEALGTMVNIVNATEGSIDYWGAFENWHADTNMTMSVTNAISHATCTTAMNLRAAAIVTVSKSGSTARMISRFRPQCPIIASTISRKVQRQLNLSWGVCPAYSQKVTSTDELFDIGVQSATDLGLAASGDLLVITAGVPVGISGTTNILKVQMVGNVLVRGTGVGDTTATGELVVGQNEDEALHSFFEGCILVVAQATKALLPIMSKASALVIEDPDPDGDAAVVATALGIPTIIGCENALQVLKSGRVVTVDAAHGSVRYGE